MSAAGALVATLFPLVVLFVVFRLVESARAVRWDATLRQIALTDAIHRDLGAVVAPTVTRGLFGRWRVRVAVPFEQPALVGRVLEIAHDTAARYATVGGRAWEFVLVAQAPAPTWRRYRCAFDGRPRLVPGTRALFS
ncbi:MAG: hypothetical protein ACREER_13025 [Alphaproteobacteria bacterium]